MTDRRVSELRIEAAAQPQAMDVVASHVLETATRPQTRAFVAEHVTEMAAAPTAGAHVSSMTVEIVRRDTMDAAMSTDAMLVLGEASIAEPAAVFAFRHDWDKPLVERWQWSTSIAKVASGIEQRKPKRTWPRRSITYQVGHGSPDDGLVSDWLESHLGRRALWPLYQYAVPIIAPAHAGDDTLQLSADDAAWLLRRLDYAARNGQYLQRWAQEPGVNALIHTRDGGWMAANIKAYDDGSVSLNDVLERAIDAGSMLVPLAAGYALDAGSFAQSVPGIADGSVTASIDPEPMPAEPVDDPLLAGDPVWPAHDWANDGSIDPGAEVAQLDLSPALPWVRRNDPWPTTALQRRYLARGRVEIEAWRARLYAARGRLGACWIEDAAAPVLRVSTAAGSDDGFLAVTGSARIASRWHRPAGAVIRHPDGRRQYALISAVHADMGAVVVVLGSPLEDHVPAGSTVTRIVRCRLDHDAIDLHWHTRDLIEIPLTLRRLSPPRGNDLVVIGGD